jgi:hypothetical protein
VFMLTDICPQDDRAPLMFTAASLCHKY